EIRNLDIQKGGDAGGGFAEEPDMRDRYGQFDMAHTFTANLGLRDFNAAAVADNAFVLHPLVFTAITLPVTDRAENPFTEQTISLGLERPIVNGFRLTNFAIRPRKNLLGAGQTDPNCVKIRKIQFFIGLFLFFSRAAE